MASLDNLQPDQRAVLQMVLQRGRSYDEIANLLGIDRAAVRQRALDAFDALTPMAVIPGPERALVTDYLLGQLPAMVAEQVFGYLEASEPDREWGLAMSRVLAPLAPGAMPEIPLGAPLHAGGSSAGRGPDDDQPVGVGHEADSLWPTEPEAPAVGQPALEPTAPLEPELPGQAEPPVQFEPNEQPVAETEPSRPEAEASEHISDTPDFGVPAPAPVVVGAPARVTARERERREAASPPRRRSAASSGRLWLWGVLTLLIVAAVVVIVVATSGSSKPATNHRKSPVQTETAPTTPTQSHTTQTATGTTQTATHTTQTGTRTTPQLRRLALLHLSSPTGAAGTTGIAQVVSDRRVDSIVITAQGVPANTAQDAYAVWLSNSLADSVRIGWVSNLVGKNGVISTEGTLPARAGRYHRVLITLETQAKPTEPGQVVLAGVFREHS